MDNRVEQWRNGEKKEVEDLLDVFISVKDTNGSQCFAEIKANCTVR